MNQYGVSGTLRTYAEKSVKAKDKEQLKKVVRDLREELDLRKITFEDNNQTEREKI